MALVAIPTTATAHTPDELDAFVAAWIDTALDEGVTISAVAEWTDMAARHPRFFGRPAPAPTAAPRRMDPPGAGTAGVEQWRPLVASYFRSGDVDRALRIMSCESGGDPGAYNSGSGASGLFQHLRRWWTKRSAAAGFSGADPFDPTANVATAAWLLRANGWGSWTCRG